MLFRFALLIISIHFPVKNIALTCYECADDRTNWAENINSPNCSNVSFDKWAVKNCNSFCVTLIENFPGQGIVSIKF